MNAECEQILNAVASDNLTVREAADRFGSSVSRIYAMCKKFGVVPRAGRPPRCPQLADREWLHRKIIIENMAYREVAEIVGCSRQRVHQKAKLFDLCRPRKVARKILKPCRTIPLKGLLDSKRLRGTYKGKLHIAHVFPSGSIKLLSTGQVCDDPDTAAAAVCKRPVNGWDFWQYKAAPGTWKPIRTLMEQ